MDISQSVDWDCPSLSLHFLLHLNSELLSWHLEQYYEQIRAHESVSCPYGGKFDTRIHLQLFFIFYECTTLK